MTRRVWLAMFGSLLVLSACSGGGDDDADEAVTTTTIVVVEAETTVAPSTTASAPTTTEVTPDLSRERLQTVFENAGSSPAVAQCYAAAIIAAGYDAIVDMDDVSQALEQMSAEERAEMDACLSVG